MKLSQKTLPENFKSILWSFDFNRLDPIKHRRTITAAAINYGTLNHWRWLIKQYGLSGVRQTIETIPVTTLRPGAARLAKLIFKVEKFNDVPRSTHPRT